MVNYKKRNLMLGLPPCKTGKHSCFMRLETTRLCKYALHTDLGKCKHFYVRVYRAVFVFVFFLHGTLNSVSKHRKKRELKNAFSGMFKYNHLLSTSTVQGGSSSSTLCTPFMNPLINPVCWVMVLSSFHPWENWGIEVTSLLSHNIK